MKLSLRTKLFLGMSGLIVFFVVTSWFLNSQFLGRYYLAQKKETLISSKNEIEKIYKEDTQTVLFELEKLQRNRGISIYFLDPVHGLPYNTSPFFNEYKLGPKGRLPLINALEFQLNDLSPGDYTTAVVKDPRLETNFLVLASKLDNDGLLVLSTPLVAINENAAIANRFFLYTGILAILFGGIAVFFFARRFTKPILELNDIAQRMTKLDFSKKYEVQSEDEVGQLGSSINSMSDQLDIAISGLKEANQKLIEDIERERRIDMMRKEFVSNVSHELKTPIALIQGYAEGLKLNVNEDEENKDFYCHVIMDETSKMNRLVRDLLDLSQIESGQFRLEKTSFEISSLVEYVLDKFKPMLVEKGVTVEVEKTDNLTISGDIIRIEQVLVNYLNNALNHVDANKEIKIKIEPYQEKVRVSVFNSGKNIPAEALEKIWTSFYKVDKARTRAYGGTGLGLSVVRAIMELHNNAFGVENKDNGVTFWFDIDRA